MTSNSHFDTAVEASFRGMDHFVTTKTVVGDTVEIDDVTILPLVDVICGMAVGTSVKDSKNRGGGGMSVGASPSAILVIQNGSTRLVNIKSQNIADKMLDMVPDIANKFINGKVTVGEEFSADTVKVAEEMASAKAEETEQSGSGAGIPAFVPDGLVERLHSWWDVCI